MPESEAEKILSQILPVLEGRSVLDLGCGMRKVVPWATGVDDGSENRQIRQGFVRARIDPESRDLEKHFGPASHDVVFSSHALEHVRAPIRETLSFWLSFVKLGGRLILYLPNEEVYVFDQKNAKARNPGHAHLLTPAVFRWHLEQLPVQIEVYREDPRIYDHYSFLVVCVREK